MACKINNNISTTTRNLIRGRFKKFIDSIGGATTVSKDTSYSYGYLRSILGSKDRLPSPSLIQSLTNKYQEEVDSKFSREYLRPDVTNAQWRTVEKDLLKTVS